MRPEPLAPPAPLLRSRGPPEGVLGAHRADALEHCGRCRVGSSVETAPREGRAPHAASAAGTPRALLALAHAMTSTVSHRSRARHPSVARTRGREAATEMRSLRAPERARKGRGSPAEQPATARTGSREESESEVGTVAAPLSPLSTCAPDLPRRIATRSASPSRAERRPRRRSPSPKRKGNPTPAPAGSPSPTPGAKNTTPRPTRKSHRSSGFAPPPGELAHELARHLPRLARRRAVHLRAFVTPERRRSAVEPAVPPPPPLRLARDAFGRGQRAPRPAGFPPRGAPRMFLFLFFPRR